MKQPKHDKRLRGILSKLNTLENCILLVFWSVIMERFHQTSIKLQRTNMDLNEAVKLLRSLNNYVSLRDSFPDVVYQHTSTPTTVATSEERTMTSGSFTSSWRRTAPNRPSNPTCYLRKCSGTFHQNGMLLRTSRRKGRSKLVLKMSRCTKEIPKERNKEV